MWLVEVDASLVATSEGHSRARCLSGDESCVSESLNEIHPSNRAGGGLSARRKHHLEDFEAFWLDWNRFGRRLRSHIVAAGIGSVVVTEAKSRHSKRFGQPHAGGFDFRTLLCVELVSIRRAF